MQGLEEATKEEFEEEGEEPFSFKAKAGVVISRDDTVDLDENVIDKGDEAMKSLGDSRASTKSFDVSQVVEDMEKERIRKTIESINRSRHDV